MSDFEQFKKAKQIEEIKEFVNDLKVFTQNAEEIIERNAEKIEADNDEIELAIQSSLKFDNGFQILCKQIDNLN